MNANVEISKSALFELVMAAFEAYAVKHQGVSKLTVETAAHLWGKYSYRSGVLKCAVKHVSVETSAVRRPDGVDFQHLSLEIKKDIAEIFNNSIPHEYNYVGTFHSHPYVKGKDGPISAKVIRTERLFDLSKADHKAEIGTHSNAGRKKFSVALIITIFAMDKADDRLDTSFSSDVFEFSMGNVKLWLKAQAFEHKDMRLLTDEDEMAFEQYGLLLGDYNLSVEKTSVGTKYLPVPITTTLKCEFLSDNRFLFQSFGRLDLSEVGEGYKNAKKAEKRWFK